MHAKRSGGRSVATEVALRPLLCFSASRPPRDYFTVDSHATRLASFLPSFLPSSPSIRVLWCALDFHLGLLRDACRRGLVDMHDADTVDSVPLVGFRLALAEEDVAEMGPAVIAHRLVLRRTARGERVR